MCESIERTETGLPAILLMSHGPLCNAILESAVMINNDTEEIYTLPFTESTGLDEYREKAAALYKTLPEGSIVLFDLFCGTPFNQMAMTGERIYGLSGLNLPMLVDAMAFRRSMRGAELIKALSESAKDGIVSMEEFLGACTE